MKATALDLSMENNLSIFYFENVGLAAAGNAVHDIICGLAVCIFYHTAEIDQIVIFAQILNAAYIYSKDIWTIFFSKLPLL